MNNFSEYMRYEEGVLYWKRKTASKCKVKVGSIVGCIRSDGYVSLGFLGKRFFAHRIIWEMHFGPIPKGMQIDHIDGDRSNNKIENLRVVNDQLNRLNSNKYKNNKTGVTGVMYDKSAKSWRAHFLSKPIGRYKSFVDACEARIVAEVSSKLCTERHGK